MITIGADPGNDGVSEGGNLGRVKTVPKIIQPDSHGVTGSVITHVEGGFGTTWNGDRRTIRSSVTNTVGSHAVGPRT